MLTAAGGVVFRNGNLDEGLPEVLMIFRKGVWDLPKGKLEQGESIRECAAREVSEEVGCSLPVIQVSLNETYHEYREGGKEIGKTTHWFAMNLENPQQELQPQIEEEIQKVIWVPLNEATEQVGYRNLVEVLNKFRSWYTTNK